MLKAIIFDMNGVVINDERIHQESWRRYCIKHDLHLSEEDFKHRVFGRTESEVLAYLHGRIFSAEELEADSNERVEQSIEIFRPQIKLTDGLGELLEELRELAIPLAIATSSRRKYFEFIMTELDLYKYFKAAVTAEEISAGKPDPEIYLKAAKAINMRPQDCVAVEDTISGITSAQAAGMKVTAIASTHEANELRIADRIIGTFEEIDAHTLLEIV